LGGQSEVLGSTFEKIEKFQPETDRAMLSETSSVSAAASDKVAEEENQQAEVDTTSTRLADATTHLAATETPAIEVAATEVIPEAVVLDGATSESIEEVSGSALKLAPMGFPALGGSDGPDDLLSASAFAKLDNLGVDGVNLTLDNDLQERAEKLLKDFRVPYGSLVAIDPQTGRVIAMASHSETDPDTAHIALRATFPAASLFKIVTAAAAIEHAGLDRESVIRYRGGNYTLNRYNFAPSSRDRKRMTLGLALGKSCNPAFARIALRHLNADTLSRYAGYFGFNRSLGFDVPMEESLFEFPEGDYATARTAAGFQNAKISPLHAAMIAASIGNRGVMMRPYLIDRFEDSSTSYRAKPTVLGRAVLPSTAAEVLRAMESSTTDGTARKQFRRTNSRTVKTMRIASKTGTLSGHNPEGVYHWFVAVAPADNPQVAIAALVINKGPIRLKGTGLGRRFLEYYFEAEPKLQTVKRNKLSNSRSTS
jgi:hypothetical protein